MTLAENVKAIRLAHKLTQVAAAARAGIPQNRWSGIECGSGNVTLDTLTKLARGLGCTVGELVEG